MTRLKRLLERIKPDFWDESKQLVEPGLFNYRRIWKLTVLCVSLVSITPLVLLSVMDYNLSRKAVKSEASFPMLRLVSNTSLNVSTFLQEKESLLSFILKNNTYEKLQDSEHLNSLLADIRSSFGGFADLGVLDSRGIQISYAGPFDFQGKNYRSQKWFQKVVEKKVYVSNVFRGYRDEPHLVIALKKDLPGNNFFILRATIDIERFNRLIRSINIRPTSDAFLINTDGVLQTPSAYHGQILEKVDLPLDMLEPADSEVLKLRDQSDKPFFLAYSFIENSPFIFLLVKPQKDLMQNWWKVRLELTGFMIISVTSILIVILSVATWLVSRIYDADIKRTNAVHKIEHTNKMASIGRLAAGVAHEINNPLAVINEKAGLLQDLFKYSEKYAQDQKLSNIADSIIHSVERCSTITRRLLGFARHVDIEWQKVSIDKIIQDVLGFLDKEARYRDITVNVEIPGEVPRFVSDQGQLEQIFLNIINNAFAAVYDKGRIDVIIDWDDDYVRVKVKDNGCGISKENMKRIFEPFFTTKRKQGTGLGLSITYGLVKKLGGELSVSSELGKGSEFVVSLPRNFDPEKDSRKQRCRHP
ncbi:MAG: sensor histidine kinase [Desulfonatronovibrionaceae bacterium]